MTTATVTAIPASDMTVRVSITVAGAVAGENLGTHLLDVVGDFRNEDDVRRTAESGVERDESRLAAHDLHDDDSVVAFRRGVQLVDRLDGEFARPF